MGRGLTTKWVGKRVCFFSNEPLAQLQKEQYSIQDITILNELGFQVTIATSFPMVPLGCDLYFSWWASGSILPLIKARLSRKPILVVAGGNEAMFYRDSISGAPLGYLAAPWYKKLATRLCLHFADQVLTVSEFMVDNVVAMGAKAPAVVHNSVDTEKFSVMGKTGEYVTTIFNLEEGVVLLKRGEVLLRAIPAILREFPNQKFAIIGAKRDAFMRMSQLAQDLGINDRIEFVGSMDNHEIVRWLQNSKVYVQISDTETFGVAIAEAMSCGIPVVVSRRGAIPELVGDCGVYVDHNRPESVAEGITHVLSDPEGSRQKYGFAGRKRVMALFSYQKRKEKIKSILAQYGL